MSNIDTSRTAIMLIKILYKQGKINEQTYKNVVKKYDESSQNGNSSFLIIVKFIVLAIKFVIKMVFRKVDL
ncbi:hypothetical protein [Lacrimispora brassicae]